MKISNPVLALSGAALLALAPAASAQAPGPAANTPAASIPGVSAAGNAVVTKLQRQDDPQLRDTIGKLRALVPQLSQVAQAPTIDVDKFGALMKQQDVLVNQLKTRQTDRILQVLRALPAADRKPFLMAIAAKVPNQPPK